MPEIRLPAPNLPPSAGVITSFIVNEDQNGPLRASIERVRDRLIIPGAIADFGFFGVLPTFQGTEYQAKLALESEEPGNGFYDDDGDLIDQTTAIRNAISDAFNAGYAGIRGGRGWYVANKSLRPVGSVWPAGFVLDGAGRDVTYFCRTHQDRTLMDSSPFELCFINTDKTTKNSGARNLTFILFGAPDPKKFVLPVGTTTITPFSTVMPGLRIVTYQALGELRPAWFQILSGVARDVANIVADGPTHMLVTLATPHTFAGPIYLGSPEDDFVNFATFKDLGGATQLNGDTKAFRYEVVDNLTIRIDVPDSSVIGAYTSGGRVSGNVGVVDDPTTGVVTLMVPADGLTEYTFIYAVRSALQSPITGNNATAFWMHNCGVKGPWYTGGRFPDNIATRIDNNWVVGILDRGLQQTNEGRACVISDNLVDGESYLMKRYAIKRVQHIQSTPKAVISISRTCPAVVEITAHGMSVGEVVKLAHTDSTDIVDQVNVWEAEGQPYPIGRVIDANHIELHGTDFTTYSAYVGSGIEASTSRTRVACLKFDEAAPGVPSLYDDEDDLPAAEILIGDVDGAMLLSDRSYRVKNLDEVTVTVGGVDYLCDEFDLMTGLNQYVHQISLPFVFTPQTGWVCRCIRVTGYNIECAQAFAYKIGLTIRDNISRRAGSRGMSIGGGGRGVIVTGNTAIDPGRYGVLGLSFQAIQPENALVTNNSVIGGLYGHYFIDCKGFDIHAMVEGALVGVVLQRCTQFRIGGSFTGRVNDATKAIQLNNSSGVTFASVVSRANTYALHVINSQHLRGTIDGYGDENGFLFTTTDDFTTSTFDFDVDISYHCSQLRTRAVLQSSVYGTGVRISGQALGSSLGVQDLADASTRRHLNDYSDLALVAGNRARDYIGAGSPEGVIYAPKGATYRQIDGSGATLIWEKGTSTGNTGWASS